MNAHRQLEHALRQIEHAHSELFLRAPAVLDRNERGGTAERDGYSASSLGGGVPQSILHCFTHGKDNCQGENGEGCDLNEPIDAPSDPTGNAVGARPSKDELDTCARSTLHNLDEAVKHLQRALSAVALGEHLANPDRRGNPPTHCQACARLVYCTSADPIRSGYCDACRKAWGRYQEAERSAGREADRVRFEHLRKREAA